MARPRPKLFRLCAAMIGCDGGQYIKTPGAEYCSLCRAEVEKRNRKPKPLKGERYMEYALAHGKESNDG